MTATGDALRSGGTTTRHLAWASSARAELSGPNAAARIVAALIAALFALPVISVLWLAFAPDQQIWQHLVDTVLPGAVVTTLALLFGTGIATLLIGTAAAWLVTMYRFPGRTLADRLLVLPLAMPAYIVAYAYVELLDFAGPLQSMLREGFGRGSLATQFFPDIRSFGGAMFVFASVLYPYVYLSARASFIQQSICVLEVARTLGRTSLGAFFSVALPMARPALAAGCALVGMEVLNDLGAVQYLGVETMTASVYATWLQRGSLSGAAQIASVMLVLVFALLIAERHARGGARIEHTTGRYRSIPFETLVGWRAALALALVLIPFLAGFALPVGVLVSHAASRAYAATTPEFLAAGRNSVVLAAIVSVFAVTVALFLGYTARVARHWLTDWAARLSSLGYALPGTVLAIGLIYPLAGLDNAIDGAMRTTFGVGTGLLLSGSLFAVALALVIRFLAVALGSIEAGLARLSPSLDAAARTLGASPWSTLSAIHLPLIAPALGAAGLLVFVDAMKELPATLLLRPFNFDTLATHVYGLAAVEQFEEAAFGALAIVAIGLLPVLLLHRAITEGRTGSSGA
ncbi:MAG: ABC transporter permease [Hyphomicrobium sp.]